MGKRVRLMMIKFFVEVGKRGKAKIRREKQKGPRLNQARNQMQSNQAEECSSRKPGNVVGTLVRGLRDR
jgi:hypothetical protein